MNLFEIKFISRLNRIQQTMFEPSKYLSTDHHLRGLRNHLETKLALDAQNTIDNQHNQTHQLLRH